MTIDIFSIVFDIRKAKGPFTYDIQFFYRFFVMAWIFSIFVVHMTNFIMGIWKIWPPGHFEGFFQLKSRIGFSSSKIWSKSAIFHTISLPNIKNYWKNVNYHLNFSKLDPRHHKYSQNNKNQAEEIVIKISQSHSSYFCNTFDTLILPLMAKKVPLAL